jgi:hypothetical protein
MALPMNFATTAIPKVSKAAFDAALQPGDAIYCWGTEEISKLIEGIAGGPSHVLTIWRPGWPGSQWLTLESTFPDPSHISKSGVHVGMLYDYLTNYPGNLVLTRRPSVTQEQIDLELTTGLGLLDDNYNWQTEVSVAARKLIPWLPLIQERNELYCSGLREVMCAKTVPYQKCGPYPNTPEQDFQDSSTEAICILMQGVK